MPFVGIGVGIGRQRFAQGGIFAAYAARVAADGGVTEAGACVNAVSGISLNSSLLLVPSGYKSGVVYSQIPTNGDGDLTFTRASDATRVNSDGEIEVVGSGVPRLDYSQGSCPALLLEPQRTNSIRNSSMVGAVAGSPGTLPSTSWNSFVGGLTQTIIGTGIENGLPYIDIRYNGTASAASVLIGLEQANFIAVTVGQSWTESAYCKIIAAPSNANSFALLVYERNSSASYIGEGSTIIVPTSDLQRFTFSRTISGATAAFLQPYIRANLTNGGTYDFTIRIAAPQLEEGAYATSYISTTSATVTRLGDTCSKTGISSLIGQQEGVIYWEGILPQASSNGASFNSNIFNTERQANTRTAISIAHMASTSTISVAFFTGNGTFAPLVTLTAASFAAGSFAKIAFAYKSGSFALYVNGVLKASSALTFTSITTMGQINLHDNVVYYGYTAQQFVKQLLIFPTRLTNAELQSLTTL